MIQPAYVTFEQAKKLKEKGFSQGVSHYYEHSLTEVYHEDDGFDGPFSWRKGETYLQNTGYFRNNTKYDSTNENWFYCEAPEQWQVVEWLRIKYGIEIYLRPERNVRVGITTYYYGISKICETNHLEIVDVVDLFNSNYSTPQEAYSAAIDYVLNNLI